MSFVFAGENEFEVGGRVLNKLLDFCVPKIAKKLPPRELKRQCDLASRRLATIAVALQREEMRHVSLADVGRTWGVTKQAVNLDAHRIATAFNVVSPTSHRRKNPIDTDQRER